MFLSAAQEQIQTSPREQQSECGAFWRQIGDLAKQVRPSGFKREIARTRLDAPSGNHVRAKPCR